MPKVWGTICEAQGNIRGDGGKHVGKSCLWEFPRPLVTSFQATSFIDRRPTNVGESPLFSPHIFSCEAIRNLSMKQDDRGTGCTCVFLDLFYYRPDILRYSRTNLYQVDSWETWFIPKNQNKFS